MLHVTSTPGLNCAGLLRQWTSVVRLPVAKPIGNEMDLRVRSNALYPYRKVSWPTQMPHCCETPLSFEALYLVRQERKTKFNFPAQT